VNRFIKAALLIALLASPAAIHIALFHSASRVLPLALVILQLGGLGLLAATRLTGPLKWLVAALVAVIGLAAFHFGTLGIALSSGVSHAVINGAAAILFASSLQAGREPLVTGLIRRIRGPLPPELLRYGRQLTLFWCGAALGQLLISLLLLLTAPLSTWSLFINIVSAPLVLVIFAVEILYHTIRFRHLPRSRVTDLIKTMMHWRGLGSAGKTVTN
jgi:uncharacterized membrane protein